MLISPREGKRPTGMFTRRGKNFGKNFRVIGGRDPVAGTNIRYRLPLCQEVAAKNPKKEKIKRAYFISSQRETAVCHFDETSVDDRERGHI